MLTYADRVILAEGPPELGWLQAGGLVFVVMLFVTDRIVSGSMYRQLMARLEEMDKHMREIVIPAFSKTTEAVEDNTEVMRELVWRLKSEKR